MGALTGCRDITTETHEETTPQQTSYRLSVADKFQTEGFSSPYSNWKKSLINNLGYSKSKIFSRDFMCTNLILSADDEPSGHSVYISRSEPRLYLIPELHLLISFDERIVGTMGVAGISMHLTNDKKFATLIHPSGSNELFGVPVGDHKTDSPEPEFKEGHTVIFQR